MFGLIFFKEEKKNLILVTIILWENTLLDRLIVMDDVPGLADKSENFPNFFTVPRKFGFTCVYIFHTNYPTRNNWENDTFTKKNF